MLFRSERIKGYLKQNHTFSSTLNSTTSIFKLNKLCFHQSVILHRAMGDFIYQHIWNSFEKICFTTSLFSFENNMHV